MVGRARGRSAGGYHLTHVAYATLGVLEGALGVDTGVADRFAWIDGDAASARESIDGAIAAHADRWPPE